MRRLGASLDALLKRVLGHPVLAKFWHQTLAPASVGREGGSRCQHA
jgi:hypothetical protein